MKHLITTPGPYEQYSINKIINSTYFRECIFTYRKIIMSEFFIAIASKNSIFVRTICMRELLTAYNNRFNDFI